ncbi:MAG: hypothetical protein ANABAC_3308 [Anaerolineae bacterium]|jgi:steroid 5-alpha reductase family enzyme|nr:MAG: hypothetical protein ANABAC_3308 [Anaerolineae bacterium]
MAFWESTLLLSLVIFGAMTLLWLLSLRLRDAGIVDVFWGIGFVILVWGAFFLSGADLTPRKVLMGSLVSLWGLRLAMHIFLRNRGKPEDYRYAAWRQEAGHSWWWRSYFKVFLLQGIIMLIVAAPLLAVQMRPNAASLTWLDWLAVSWWLIGFIFEAGGDWQLRRFKANPANRGKVLQSGFWRYTRHPNYFGDAVQWWAFYLIALADGAWWTIFSPLLMTYLLVRVSGVAMLEKSLQTAKPQYREYIERTSPFLPWFPKSTEKGGNSSLRKL